MSTEAKAIDSKATESAKEDTTSEESKTQEVAPEAKKSTLDTVLEPITKKDDKKESFSRNMNAVRDKERQLQKEKQALKADQGKVLEYNKIVELTKKDPATLIAELQKINPELIAQLSAGAGGKKKNLSDTELSEMIEKRVEERLREIMPAAESKLLLQAEATQSIKSFESQVKLFLTEGAEFNILNSVLDNPQVSVMQFVDQLVDDVKAKQGADVAAQLAREIITPEGTKKVLGALLQKKREEAKRYKSLLDQKSETEQAPVKNKEESKKSSRTLTNKDQAAPAIRGDAPPLNEDESTRLSVNILKDYWRRERARGNA